MTTTRIQMAVSGLSVIPARPRLLALAVLASMVSPVQADALEPFQVDPRLLGNKPSQTQTQPVVQGTKEPVSSGVAPPSAAAQASTSQASTSQASTSNSPANASVPSPVPTTPAAAPAAPKKTGVPGRPGKNHAGEAPGQPPLTHIEADKIDGRTDVEMRASGKAHLTREDLQLDGETVTLDQLSDVATAEGSVKMTRGPNWISGPRAQVNIVTFFGEFETPEYSLQRPIKKEKTQQFGGGRCRRVGTGGGVYRDRIGGCVEAGRRESVQFDQCYLFDMPVA